MGYGAAQGYPNLRSYRLSRRRTKANRQQIKSLQRDDSDGFTKTAKIWFIWPPTRLITTRPQEQQILDVRSKRYSTNELELRKATQLNCRIEIHRWSFASTRQEQYPSGKGALITASHWATENYREKVTTPYGTGPNVCRPNRFTFWCDRELAAMHFGCKQKKKIANEHFFRSRKHHLDCGAGDMGPPTVFMSTCSISIRR